MNMIFNDDLLFCYECTCFVYEYCSLHGPLLAIPNTKKSSKKSELSNLLAKYTIPSFLRITSSSLSGAGLGVFTTLTLSSGIRFGPYEGSRVSELKSNYSWQILNKIKYPIYVDGFDENNANWMRYINCSRHFSEQNLIAFQFKGEIYYRTIKTIPRGTELLVYYGSEYASTLHNIDLYNYNNAMLENNFKVSYGSPSSGEAISAWRILCTNKGKEKNNNIQHKTYMCVQCDYITHTLNSIKRHVSTHSNNNPFICHICSFKTKTRAYLKKHLKNHRICNYTCSLCNYTTSVKESLRLHELIHLPHEPVTCKVCGFLTKNKKYLNKHIKVRHSVL